jgi:hypothetical protein
MSVFNFVKYAHFKSNVAPVMVHPNVISHILFKEITLLTIFPYSHLA